MNWLNCYNANGVFGHELFFIENFGTRPNSTSITFNDNDDECALEKVTNDLLYAEIPNIKSIYKFTNKYTLDPDESSKDKFLLRISNSGTGITILTDNYLIYIDYNSITIKYITFNGDIDSFIRNLWLKLPKREKEKKLSVVHLVAYSNGDYYLIESKIKETKMILEENYNDDFLPVNKDIIDFLNTRESGLVLLWGEVGTGKTSYIRHLCSNYANNYIIVPTSMTTRLADPDFISFMIDNSDSVFILEDCEQVLLDRSVNMFNGAISNILNMSDGLLSDIMNLKFICTFNADINAIDQALLRKGRCYGKYEFRELCEDKVKTLNDKYNLNLQDIKPMTLAEIYNAERTEYSEKKTKKKIGF